MDAAGSGYPAHPMTLTLSSVLHVSSGWLGGQRHGGPGLGVDRMLKGRRSLVAGRRNAARAWRVAATGVMGLPGRAGATSTAAEETAVVA